MTNTQMLEAKITDSGLKKAYIAKQLNITNNTLAKKLTGKVAFKTSEAAALVKLLRLSQDDAVTIFLS